VHRVSDAEPFTIEIKREFPEALVIITGEVDASNVGALYENFAALAREGIQRLSLNLAELTFMDSTGLSFLVSVHKRAQALGGELVISAASTQIRQLFSVTGVDSYFNIEPEARPEPEPLRIAAG
jgi:anti-sigma B factor antagonist